MRGHVSSEWGTTPANPDRLPEWAGQAATKRAETAPRVADAVQSVEAATADGATVRKRQQQEHTALLVGEYGAEHAQAARYGMRTTIDPRRRAHDAKNRSALLRSESEELRALPINDAAHLIETKHAAQDQARQDATKRARELNDPFQRDPPPHRPEPRGSDTEPIDRRRHAVRWQKYGRLVRCGRAGKCADRVTDRSGGDESGRDVGDHMDGCAGHERSRLVTQPAEQPAGGELHRDHRPHAHVDQQ